MTEDSGTPHRRTVLYVEDIAVNALLMRTLFERRPDLHLVLAENGQQALCIASHLRPSLMLLDLNLPDCHGSDLLPLLRQLPGCESAPAVAVTADAGFTIAGTGFTELWTKPLNLKWVLERLDPVMDEYPTVGAQRWSAAAGRRPPQTFWPGPVVG